MTHLRAPGLGPIVGHTTANSARIWIRGAEDSASSDRALEMERTVGVAAIFAQKSGKPGVRRSRPETIQYFRLRREYDRTGCVDFTDLVSDSAYVVLAGTLHMPAGSAETTIDDDELFSHLPPASAWLDELRDLPETSARAAFRTQSAEAGGALAFLFGSCRYPGIFAQQSRLGDRIFAAMQNQLHSEYGPARFVMMLGDQIYADLFNHNHAIGRADTHTEFQERYHSAFGTPNLRKLMQSVPTYMILDDHEIEDNWHQSRVHRAEKRHLFNTAISAYRSYQWVHGPRNFGERLFYSFEIQGYPFFVLDVRTQRVKLRGDANENHLLGFPAKDSPYPNDGKHPKYPGQLDQLCRWLIDAQKRYGDRPKFIASPGVFVPNTIQNSIDPRAGDSWSAFPSTRRTLLTTIARNNIQNVVFLCGDVHCSIVAEMSFYSKGRELPLRAFSITSSAFYWPFPFSDGDPNTFVHASGKDNDDFEFDRYTMRYRCHYFEQEDNFTRVDLDAEQITVRVFDRRGQLRSKSPDGDYSTRLELGGPLPK